jgi:hypothetical protein
MSRDGITGRREDEDTQPFLGHMTLQAHDEPEAEPEQNPDGPIRRQSGPERSPAQDEQKRRKDNKRNRDTRK